MTIATKLTPLIVLIVLFLAPSIPAKIGPGGTVRTICLGDVIDQYGGFNSFVVIRTDPAIDTTLVPSRPTYSGLNVVIRNMRIYMPRTYDLLVENYDLVLTSDMDQEVFKARWILWLSDSVTDGGCDLLWLGSIVHFGKDTIDWRGTTLAEILPVNPTEPYDTSGSFRVIIEMHDEPLMEALPWERAPPLANLHTESPKQGSQLWATIKHPKAYPLMTHWKIGEGAVLCFASKSPGGVEPWVRDWDYYQQAMIYLVYRTAGKELPGDPLLYHKLLSGFSEYKQMNSMVLSLFSFIETFGGRVDRLYQRLDELAVEKGHADDAYMESSFDECLEIMSEIKAEQHSLIEASLKERDTALLWVHITEWCATTAALILGSMLVWALMIRRSLYRDIEATRIQPG